MCIASLFSLSVAAQDVVVLRTGAEVKAKVLEIGASDVKYKKWNNQNGATVVTPKSEVFMVKYKNGKKEVFEKTETKTKAKAQEVQIFTPKFPKPNIYNLYNLSALGPNARLEVIRKRRSSGLINTTTCTELTDDEAKKVLGSAFDYYSDQDHTMKKGFKIAVVGGMFHMGSLGFIAMMTKGSWDGGNFEMVFAGIVCFSVFNVIGGVMLPVGLEKYFSGRKNCQRIVGEANMSAMSFEEVREPMKLKLGFTGNGVGMAVNF